MRHLAELADLGNHFFSQKIISTSRESNEYTIQVPHFPSTHKLEN